MRNFQWLLLVGAFGFTIACGGAEVGVGEAPNSIYINGKIVTVDNNFSYAEALAITGDKFVAVGSNEEISALADSQTKITNLCREAPTGADVGVSCILPPSRTQTRGYSRGHRAGPNVTETAGGLTK